MSPHLKGQLIVLEGIDGAGKSTQVQLLSAYLSRKGITTEQIKFPRYETFFGQLVLQFLNGELGSIDEVSPYLASIVFALDRSAIKQKLYDLLNEGTTLILDRYIGSNMAHQAAKLPPEKRQQYLDWVHRLEYIELGLPKEDIVMYLDTPPLLSKPRLKWKEGVDIHEENIEYQKETHIVYEELAAKYPHWEKITCIDTDYNLLPPDKIRQEIVKKLG
ncbi:deoxynucleoside kinase [Candidatus Microgenomates bacterium]|nr:deoxynucleoside kinase [Candidatus Microgenomates bacterium]